MNDACHIMEEYRMGASSQVLKNLEQRWGLTLVSFLSPDDQKKFLDAFKAQLNR